MKCIPASVACYTHWAFAAIALILLILAQSYYVVGTNLIQPLPEYRSFGNYEQAVLKGVAPRSEATELQAKPPEDPRIVNLLEADRKLLCEWLARFPYMTRAEPDETARQEPAGR